MLDEERLSPATKLGGARSHIAVPMLKEGKIVGAIYIYRQEVKPFTDKQIELVKNFAAQAVIAIENARLLNELRQRTTDLTETLEQQTATSEVLTVISSYPGELERVFQSILEKATRICEANFGTLFRFVGEVLQPVAQVGTPSELIEAQRRLGRATPGGLLDRVIQTKQVIHSADRATDAIPGLAARFGGARSVVGVPMLKDDALIGAIMIYRQEIRPFADKQIALVQNFAAQAVIAIENARLLSELRQRTTDLTERTADLTEALEQQTATSEVLKVTSSSPGQLQPVFDAMLDKAVRICRADAASLFLYENGMVRRAACHSGVADVILPIAPSAKSGTMRSIMTKQIIHIADYLAEPAYLEGDDYVVAAAERLGLRASLHVPMLREQEVVGAFTIWRTEAGAFTEKQIELVTNFAAQAVIAIENARLLNELRQRTTDLTEALEQQTATSEVLHVISSSPDDLEPVFVTMLEKAVRICEANFGNVYQWDGDVLRLVATQNTPSLFAEVLKQSPHIRPTSSLVVRLVTTKSAIQIPDLSADPDYAEKCYSAIVRAVEL